MQISDREPCQAGSGWQGVFTGQGGQTATSKTGLQCAATPKIILSDVGGLSFRLFDFGTRKLLSAKLTLPKGWSFNTAAAKAKNATWVRLTGGAGSLRLTSRSATVAATVRAPMCGSRCLDAWCAAAPARSRRQGHGAGTPRVHRRHRAAAERHDHTRR